MDFYRPQRFANSSRGRQSFTYDLFDLSAEYRGCRLLLACAPETSATRSVPCRSGAVASDDPTYTHFESVVMGLLEHVSPDREIPALTNHFPSGFFDNSSMERWLRCNLDRKSSIPNDFRAFSNARQGRSLYITACDLDTAERSIFGADENNGTHHLPGCAGFFRFARFSTSPPDSTVIDYVDGGVRHTANIDIAIEKGADLIVCYNPFRPFLNRIDAEDGNASYFADGRYLSDRGLMVVINQVFRTLLHSRLKLGIQRYLADDRFQGDIVLLEPREHDADYFATNPMAFWRRSEAVQHGFESVRSTIEQNFDQLQSVFARYGIVLDRSAARRRAARARVAQGWSGDPEPDPEPVESDAPLHLVGT